MSDGPELPPQRPIAEFDSVLRKLRKQRNSEVDSISERLVKVHWSVWILFMVAQVEIFVLALTVARMR